MLKKQLSQIYSNEWKSPYTLIILWVTLYIHNNCNNQCHYQIQTLSKFKILLNFAKFSLIVVLFLVLMLLFLLNSLIT